MADKIIAEKTATGVKPIPEGYHTVTSYLTIRDAKKAMEFYEKAFGATNRGSLTGPDGKVMHGEIKIGDTVIMICDEIPQFGHLGPQSRGGNTSSLLIYTDKVDEDFDRAVKAGCTVKQPL
jgi:PhnB protein